MKDRLIVFTHVVHYKTRDVICAHGPYVNEINVLLASVRELVVVAPVVSDAVTVPAGSSAYVKPPGLIRLPMTGGVRMVDKLGYLWKGPVLLVKVLKGIRISGILHPRAPGNVAFVALVLIWLFGKQRRKFAKFAGEWDQYEALPLTFRWQRHWLAKPWLFNGPVFVYSERSNASHIIPSFTSNLMKSDIEYANARAEGKTIQDALIIGFAGRLSRNKGVDVLINALATVNDSFQNWELRIMGDGDQSEPLKKLAAQLGISDKIKWMGWCSRETMITVLTEAHIVCQPTRFAESWGKVLQEGMVFGCVPVASAIGGLKRQLSGRPELLFESGNEKQCAAIICNIVEGRLNYHELKAWCLDQSRRYSLEALAEFTWRKYDEHYSD